MVKELNNESTVENIDQCEEGMNEDVNNNIEIADNDKHKDIDVDKHSAVNVDMLPKPQLADSSLKSIRRMSHLLFVKRLKSSQCHSSGRILCYGICNLAMVHVEGSKLLYQE
ncbi:hypothetical protein ACJMK2_032128, partial [Sinanodonta woodiana]